MASSRARIAAGNAKMTSFLLHNAGGKVLTKLPIGMRGDAGFFGAEGEYRQWLSRHWGYGSALTPFALWLGLNPSTARGDINDPTITREIGFTKRLCALNAYYKVNVMDYRSTDPKRLLMSDVKPRSENNLATIRELASRAEIIILACGVPHKSLRSYARETIDALKNDELKLWCLGTTASGWPRHPLYLSGDTPLTPFP